MEMSGEYRIEASRDAVWAALNDPEILKQAIPGCEEMTQVSATEFGMPANVTVVEVLEASAATLRVSSGVSPTEGAVALL